MVRELEQLREYYEKLARTDPKMTGMAQVLRNAGNLNDSLGGPREIPDSIVSKEGSYLGDPTLRGRILDFFVEHGSSVKTKEEKINLARKFNDEVGSSVGDHIRVRDAKIPTYPFSGVGREDEQKARAIGFGFKSFYNRVIVRSRGMTFREFRNLDPNEIPLGNVSANSLIIMQIAFARAQEETA